MILSSHPDDDILGCGGILSKFSKQVKFKIIFIGEGSSCRFDNPKSDKAKKEIKHRNLCAKNALDVFNVKEFSFYNLPCGRLDQIPLIEINKIIETELIDFKPDTVFTHSSCDSNRDHVKVYNSTVIATRPGIGIKNLYSYEVLSSTEWNFSKSFSPNTFISLSSKNIDQKCEAFALYDTESRPFPFPRNEKGIKALATMRGMQSGNNYAESFKLIRRIT